MPIHDWTRVDDGTFHSFHLTWTGTLLDRLNNGVLPPAYYALADQVAGPLGPDLLTLQAPAEPSGEAPGTGDRGGLALATVPLRLRVTAEADMNEYVLKRRTIRVRHVTGDRIVALIEIVSPGNKSSRHGINDFVEKAVESLYRGYHLLIVDLFPPGPRDPNGIHARIWGEFADDDYAQPVDEPLTLVAYSAGSPKRAYVEPTAVGRDLLEMPLFLDPETYVNVPLEETYRAAYRGVPQRWKRVLEAAE